MPPRSLMAVKSYKPNLSAAQIRNILTSTALDIEVVVTTRIRVTELSWQIAPCKKLSKCVDFLHRTNSLMGLRHWSVERVQHPKTDKSYKGCDSYRVLLEAWWQGSVGSFEQPLEGLLMMLIAEPRMVSLAVNRCRMSHLLRR